MSDERFDVKFWGEVQPGQDMEAVKAAMAGIFRLSDEQAARLFSGQQLTVARDADAARADRLKAVIEQAGGVCALFPSGAVQPPPPLPTPPPPEEPAAPEPEPPAPPVMEAPAPPEPEPIPTLESEEAPAMPASPVWGALEAETLPEMPAPPAPEAVLPPAPEPALAPAVPTYLPDQPAPRPRGRARRRQGVDWPALVVGVLAVLVALAVGYVAFLR